MVGTQGSDVNQAQSLEEVMAAEGLSFFERTCTTALCNKSNGRCDIKAEKREELESKSSHKSDIWPPAASKK